MRTILLCLLLLSIGCASRPSSTPLASAAAPAGGGDEGAALPFDTSNYDGERFFNTTPLPDVRFWALVKHITTGRSTPWPAFVDNSSELNLDAKLSGGEAAITFVNHATVLIQWNGFHILTDPVWSTRVGPFSWAGPRRVRRPGIPREMLPRIDVVLISHNHYDHLDLPTLRFLEARDAPRLVALRCRARKRVCRPPSQWQGCSCRPTPSE